jgi:ADP-heptose:LPS heptosyltransferase
MLLERRRPDLLPVFVGAPGEEPLAQEAIISARADGARTLAWDFVGKLSLWETACLLARAHAVVTVDSAPLHIAAYVGTPTISLFGPTDPARVAPRGSQHRVVQEELDCLACYRRRCPLPRRACLPDLHAERVLAALETFEECHA